MARVWESSFGLRHICLILIIHVPVVISQTGYEGTNVPGMSTKWHTPVAWRIFTKDDSQGNTSTTNRDTAPETGSDVITPTSFKHPVTSPHPPGLPQIMVNSAALSANTSNTGVDISQNDSSSVSRIVSSSHNPDANYSRGAVPSSPMPPISDERLGNSNHSLNISEKRSKQWHFRQMTLEEEPDNTFLSKTDYFQDLITTKKPNPGPTGGDITKYANSLKVLTDTMSGRNRTWTGLIQGTGRSFTDEVRGTARTFTNEAHGTDEVRGTARTFTKEVHDTARTFTNASDFPDARSTVSDRDLVSFLTGVDLGTAQVTGGSLHSTDFPETTKITSSRLDHQQTNSAWGSVPAPLPTSGGLIDDSNMHRNMSDTGQQSQSTPSLTSMETEKPEPELVITKIENPAEAVGLLEGPLFRGEGENLNVTNSKYSSRGNNSESPEYADLDVFYDASNLTYEDLFGNNTIGMDYYTDGGRMDNMTDTPEDDCLYEVYGASGRLRFPDADHFSVFETKEFVACRWRVRVPEGPNIKVNFERLALSLGVENLEIAVGMDGELKKRTYTGSKNPHDLVTMGTRLWLTARVRNDNYSDKIVLNFAETTEEGVFPLKENYTCGAILFDLQGNISSPGYPVTDYSNNQECSWYLVAPSQSVIRLTVKDFNTDVYDHVTMGIGLHAGATNSKVLTLYGRLQEQRETVIPSNSLWIHFTSDDSDTNRGFFISYQVIPRDICNGTNILTDPEGEVTSPGYPTMYGINSECTWYIQVPENAYVNITFHDMSLQDSRDFVLIGQGIDLFGGPFMTYTGNVTQSDPIRMDTHNVWIHFTSDHLDGDLSYRGFSLTYRIVDKKAEEIKTLLEEEQKDKGEEENMVMQDLPQNDEGRRQVIKIPLKGVKAEQLDDRMEAFKARLAELLNKYCNSNGKGKCDADHQLRPEELRVVSRREGERRLVVAVSLETDSAFPVPNMASADYEELERLFHSDLQSLDLQDEESSDKVSSNLPEWLIGVIIVVILLIVAFFAMVIYSLMKERKKSRAGSYGGTTSTASACEDLESGKSDGNIRITAFSLDNDKDTDTANGHSKDASNGATWTLDSEAASTLQRRQPGVSGCMNPAFIDDDAEKEEEEKEEEGKNKKDKDEAKNAEHEAKNAKEEAKNAKEEAKNAKEEAKNAKDGKKAKGSSKSAKSPKSPKKAKSPKSSKSAKNTAKNNSEEAQPVANGDSTTGKSAENGSAVKQTPAAEAQDGIVEENEDATDSKQQEEAMQEDEADAGTETTDDPQPSTSGGGGGGGGGGDSNSSQEPGRLEVVVDREITQPPNELVMQVNKDDNQGEQEHSSESSTDDKEDNTDMSTNL